MKHSYRTRTLGFLSIFLATVILLTGFWLNFSQKNVAAADTSLVAAYSFSETSGSSVIDSSSNNNNGKILNGAIRTTNGKYGSAISFDGTNDRVSIPDSASLDLKNAMTLEAWVYPTENLSHWDTIIMKQGSGKLIYTLYANGEQSKQYGIIYSNGSEQIVEGGTALPLNTWTHLAVTYDKQLIKIYKNAQLIATQQYTGTIQTSNGILSIGGNTVWNNEFFPGLIDEVRIYSRSLTQSEIQNDMETPIGINPTVTPVVTPTLTPLPTVSITPNPSQTPTPTPAACWPTATAIGALPGQPAPVFCSIVNSGPGTSISELNNWKDEFNHGLSFANFNNTNYKVFDSIGVHKTVHWRHANHWMVDLAPTDETNAGSRGNGGGLLSPDRTFKFENGKFIVETDYAAGIEGYNKGIDSAWGEIVITTGDTPVVSGPTARADRLYGYDMFPNHWTLGCRFQAEGVTICSLMNNTTLGSTNGGRTWEMSYFQQVGTTSMGGYSDGSHFRFCKGTDADMNCRDRFRLELTKTSLTIYANGVKFFEQTGIPALPDEFVNGNLHVYLGSISVGNIGDTVRFHWGPMSVNPTTAPSAAPGFGGTTMNHPM